MRHKKAEKRNTEPDKIYANRLVTKFINNMMKDGKKTVAQKEFYEALEALSKDNKNGVETFEKAIQAVGPKTEVRARRVGGANYQVPAEVRNERRISLAIRWILDAARKRSNREYHTFAKKLAAELTDASEGKGEAIKKRDTVLRMAEANRAFAHFRW